MIVEYKCPLCGGNHKVDIEPECVVSASLDSAAAGKDMFIGVKPRKDDSESDSIQKS